jgi:hypothetical protein
MNGDTVIGMGIAAILFVLGIAVYNIAQINYGQDIRRQCEAQGSVRLMAQGGEALFYCGREKR